MEEVSQKEIQNAYRYCLRLAQSHYENFPVASILVPARLRPHIAAIYAFARTADDFADEEENREKVLQWREKLHQSLCSRPKDPIFLALSHTIKKFQLPWRWLDDLLTAFLMDLTKNRFQNWEELYYYCRHSANPVGRIVLWIFGYRDEKLMAYGDSITTALQLTNFWQDLSVDIPRNRLYIPTGTLQNHGLLPAEVLQRTVNGKFIPVLEELVGKTRALFQKGSELLTHLSGRLYWELKLTVLGGMTVLKKVEKYSENVLWSRPVLTKKDWGGILFRLVN